MTIEDVRSAFFTVLVRDSLIGVRSVLEGLVAVAVVVVVEGPEDVAALTSVRFRDCRSVHEDRNLFDDRKKSFSILFMLYFCNTILGRFSKLAPFHIGFIY